MSLSNGGEGACTQPGNDQNIASYGTVSRPCHRPAMTKTRVMARSPDRAIPGNDQNIMVAFTYTPDSNIATMTAKNPVTGDQTTRYRYGTVLADSDVARNDLRVAEIYPDAADSTDCVSFTFNRQGEPDTKTDQNGTVHEYARDRFARPTSDTITALGVGVDDTVLRIDTGYEIRGMVNLITSRAGTAADSTVVNQVLREFNDFEQLGTGFQEHDGPVDTMGSPKVVYAYEDGSANTIRPTSITPPVGSGQALSFSYTADDDNALSRPTTLQLGAGGQQAGYDYFGAASVAGINYGPTSGATIGCTLASGSLYSCFDQFDRLIEVPWTKLSDSTNIVDLKYGYDLASNRTYRNDVAATAAGKAFDELYEDDGVHRLKKLHRGTLAEGNASITGPTMQQAWQLDATGNWSGFTNFDQTDSDNTLDQNRTSNAANEITAITGTVGPQWATPVYDRAGNMTSVPQPFDMSSLYDAVWDAWNRPVGFYNGATLVQGNAYDGSPSHPIILPDETRDDYYTAAWQLIQEDSTVPATTIFYWGPRYIDELIARFDLHSSAFIYSLPDANWNVVAIADTSATVLERYAYTAYGVVLFLDADFVPLSGNVSGYGWETFIAGTATTPRSASTSPQSPAPHPPPSPLGCWLSQEPPPPLNSG